MQFHDFCIKLALLSILWIFFSSTSACNFCCCRIEINLPLDLKIIGRNMRVFQLSELKLDHLRDSGFVSKIIRSMVVIFIYNV